MLLRSSTGLVESLVCVAVWHDCDDSFACKATQCVSSCELTVMGHISIIDHLCSPVLLLMCNMGCLCESNPRLKQALKASS